MKTINMDVWCEGDDPSKRSANYHAAFGTPHDMNDLQEFEYALKKLAVMIMTTHASAGGPNG